MHATTTHTETNAARIPMSLRLRATATDAERAEYATKIAALPTTEVEITTHTIEGTFVSNALNESNLPTVTINVDGQNLALRINRDRPLVNENVTVGDTVRGTYITRSDNESVIWVAASETGIMERI